MALIADVVFDQGLEVAQAGITRVDITSAEATSYANVAAVTLGNKTGLTTGAPQNGASTGRRVIIPAIASGAPGSVTASGTATHWGGDQRQQHIVRDGSADLEPGGDFR